MHLFYKYLKYIYSLIHQVSSLMHNLGNLEEIILLIMLSMDGEVYGFAVSEAYREHTGKRISISAVHTVMSRLEKKGLVNSRMGGATAARGGRRKRIFTVNAHGIETVRALKQTRDKLWTLIPNI